MTTEWLVIRGSGVVAFALLSAATIWGLLVSTKLLGRWVKAKPLTWFHESLGIGALLATLVHVLVLSFHDFLEFSWAEILVPGLSDWRPLAVTIPSLRPCLDSSSTSSSTPGNASSSSWRGRLCSR